MKSCRLPMDILKDVAFVFSAETLLPKLAEELAICENFKTTPETQVIKIILNRLVTVHGVSQENADAFVARYRAAKEQ
jgi:hypothetical protein